MKSAKSAVILVLLLLMIPLLTLCAPRSSIISLTCAYAQDIVGPMLNANTASAKGLTATQLKIARLIISIGTKRGRSLRDIKIALMTAMQESGMRNLSYGHLDSLGIYQQRAGWGTAQQRLDPVYAINKFFAALERVGRRDSMPLLEVAIAVQRPSRAAYTSRSNNFMSWESMADQLVKGVVTSVTKAPAMVYSDECTQPSGGVTTNGWHKPLDSLRVGSVWGMRYHPILHYTRLHNGVDLSASSGTPIYAVGSGTITTIASGYNGGAGNHVAIDLGGGNVVKYLHMLRFAGGISVGSKVNPGTLIGYVGSTGLSTGPHLHFSWYVNGKGVDPVPKLCQRGVVVPGPKGCSKYG